jgi:proteasome assembly chaperone (PAC2) family protein
MADPHGSNISEAVASRYDLTQPPGLKSLDLAARLRQVRIDMDALVAGVTNASVKTALSSGGADLALGGSDVTGAGAVAGASVSLSGGIGIHGKSAPGAKSAKIVDPTNATNVLVRVTEIIDVLELYGLTEA